MKMNWKKNNSGIDSSRLFFLIGYLYEEEKVKRLLKITGLKHDFTSMTPEEKTKFLYDLARENHASQADHGNLDDCYSGISRSFTVLIHALSFTIFRFSDRIQRLFIPKFYHDRKNTNFLKNLIYFGEKQEIDEKYFYENGTSLGRKLYEYRINRNKIRPLNIHPRDLDWPFPEKFYETIGYTAHGFSFKFKNAPANLKSILSPQDDLTNDGDKDNLEEANNNFTSEIFFPAKKTIQEKIAEYKAIPTTNFINESYFLYDKSNLIKNTFVTTINKQLSLYGSFSYFSGKTSVSNLELINTTDSLKFLVEKKSLKDNLKQQVAHVNGSDVKTNNKKIPDFSITKLGKRRKNMLPEPIETVIIRAQQDFDVAGGLNQIQIQISNDTVLNLLKNTKMLLIR